MGGGGSVRELASHSAAASAIDRAQAAASRSDATTAWSSSSASTASGNKASSLTVYKTRRQTRAAASRLVSGAPAPAMSLRSYSA